MSVYVVRNSMENVLKEGNIDAIIKATEPVSQYSGSECELQDSAVDSLYKTIKMTVPSADDVESDTIKDSYLAAFNYACDNGLDNIATELFYKENSDIPFSDIFDTALQAAGSFLNESDKDMDITIVLDRDAQKRLYDIIPDELKKKRKQEPAANLRTPGTGIFECISITKDYSDLGRGEFEIEIPDDLIERLGYANFERYPDSGIKPSQLLSQYAEENGFDKTSVVKQAEIYLSHGTAYSALQENCEKNISKKTIVYVGLVLGMKLEEVTDVLNAAGERFTDDAIDIIYQYAIEKHLPIDKVHQILASSKVNLIMYEERWDKWEKADKEWQEEQEKRRKKQACGHI